LVGVFYFKIFDNGGLSINLLPLSRKAGQAQRGGRGGVRVINPPLSSLYKREENPCPVFAARPINIIDFILTHTSSLLYSRKRIIGVYLL
jgi:hypothetical protein